MRNPWFLAPLGVFVLSFALLASGCGSGSAGGSSIPEGPKASGANPSKGSINAQGSTFVMPFLSKAFDEYLKKTGFQVNYTGGGSSAGIQGILEGTIPFAASDAPMNDEELGKAKGKVLNLPITLGAIAIVYNVPDVPTGLKLDGPTLADVFLAKITKWNDPRIASLNPDVKLPDLSITLQVRADGSGSTYVLSDFLSKVSPAWKEQMGVAKKLKWSQAAQQWAKSDGVASNTKATPGSISYVELSWAKKTGLSYASIKNSEGSFTLPEPKGVTAAAASVPLPPDFRTSITNAGGADSYPISSYVFGLVPEDLTGQASGKEIVQAVEYLVTEAQQYAEGLDYAPLPEAVVQAVLESLKSVKTK